MPNYGGAAIATPAAASGAAYFTINTNGTRRVRIYKFLVTNTQTVFSQFGLIRASNTPVTAAPITPAQYDVADAAATAQCATTWTTPPTVGTSFLQSVSLGPSQGAGLADQWQSDKEITLAVSTWLVVWNSGAGAGGILSVTVAFDE
jgi:hypothetical protein